MKFVIQFIDFQYEQERQRLLFYLRGFLVMFLLTALIFMASSCNQNPTMADENWTNNQIATAIFYAEGGYKAQYLYGIRSVKYTNINDARKICLNTIRNNRKRYIQYGYKKYNTYLEFLASRYCPISAHKLNKFWIRNVKFYLTKQRRNNF